MGAKPTLRSIALALLVLLHTGVAAAAPKPPEWTVGDLRRMDAELRGAARLSDPAQRDGALAGIAAAMYRVAPQPNEPPQSLASRTLERAGSDMPEVQEGQELDALLVRLYADVAERSRNLARFERDRRTRQFLEGLRARAQRARSSMAPNLQFQVDGLDGFFEPLPRVPGKTPSKRGALVKVHSGGTITVEQLDRVRFEKHHPPEDVRRTGGAIHELVAAQKQYNITARLLARYDPAWSKNAGHVQVAVPGNYPSRYLNEVLLAAKRAGMHTAHVLVTAKNGKLSELIARLRPPEGRAARRDGRQVSCPDELSMQRCAQRLRHASLRGSVVFVPS
ncbi:MAG TPA: hypothetical protein RMG48_18860 [Myxococcales bacterium LLY-WYZ-16_1]|nr:hypothetical protein [Myxococcales bacterium LLY-WYZ-16_1]